MQDKPQPPYIVTVRVRTSCPHCQKLVATLCTMDSADVLNILIIDHTAKGRVPELQVYDANLLFQSVLNPLPPAAKVGQPLHGALEAHQLRQLLTHGKLLQTAGVDDPNALP